MRKIIIPLIFILILCSCSKNSNVKPVTGNLSFTLQSVLNNNEYIIDAKTDSDSNLSLSFKAPENLKNLKMHIKDYNITVNFMDLEKEIPLKSVEEDSPISIIFEAVNTALKTEKLDFKDNEYLCDFNVKNSDYSFIFSQSGLPLSIKKNDENLILFKSVTVLN